MQQLFSFLVALLADFAGLWYAPRRPLPVDLTFTVAFSDLRPVVYRVNHALCTDSSAGRWDGV